MMHRPTEENPGGAGLGGRCPGGSAGESAGEGMSYAGTLGGEGSESRAGASDKSVMGRDA